MENGLKFMAILMAFVALGLFALMVAFRITHAHSLLFFSDQAPNIALAGMTCFAMTLLRQLRIERAKK